MDLLKKKRKEKLTLKPATTLWNNISEGAKQSGKDSRHKWLFQQVLVLGCEIGSLCKWKHN